MTHANNPHVGWSQARIEKLKTLWQQGLSASECASQLGGGVSRNAIIGKAHRLGLAGRAKATTPRPVTKMAGASQPRIIGRSAAAKPSKAAVVLGYLPSASLDGQDDMRAKHRAVGEAAIRATETREVASPDARPFMEAKRGCKWPLGTGLDMLVCCNPIARGSYCAGHARLAYSAIPQRRDLTTGKAASYLSRNDGFERVRQPKAPRDGLWDDVRAA